MRIFIILSLVLTFCIPCSAIAQESSVNAPAPEETASESEAPGLEEGISEEPYVFPQIPTAYYLSGGYHFIFKDGSSRAMEYEYLHNSLAASGGMRVFSFPQRLHLDIDIKNSKDYFGDLDYAFKDIVLLKVLERSLYHNLDTIKLIDLEPGSPLFSVDVSDAGRQYGIRSGITDVFLRVKTPEYPFHLFLAGRQFVRDGHSQQRSLLGSGYWNNLVNATQGRDADWTTHILTIGANSHLGPVEVDLSHTEKRFNPEGAKVLYDAFSTAALAPGMPPVREAGTFPYGLTPELKGSADTLKLHSSYTGGLVGTATLSSLRRENRFSGAKADYFTGAGEIVWIPSTRVAVFLRYRHKETDTDTPGSVRMTDASNSQNTYSYSVKPAISSDNDTVSAIFRYRLSSAVTLRTEYVYNHIKRSDPDPWNLPSSTDRNTIALSTDARIAKGLTLKAKYTHLQTDNPAYNTEPDRYDEGKISATWVASKNISTLLSYSISYQKRRDLEFTDAEGSPIKGPDNRDVHQDRLFGSVTAALVKDLTITASYMYMHYKVDQDLAYQSNTMPFQNITEYRLPHRDTSQNVSVDFGYMPFKQLSLNAGVSYTASKGKCGSMSSGFSESSDIDEFTDIKTREILFNLSGQYRIGKDFDFGLSYKYADFDDVYDNPNDDVSDGHANIIMIKLSRRW